jgi:hypothetical protein
MPEKKKDEHKSPALKLIDILSRPGYAVANAADVAFNKGGGVGNTEDVGVGDVLKGAMRGLKGEDQTSFIDVLQHQHINEIDQDPEYQRILKEYGTNEAAWYKETKTREKNNSTGDVVGGLLADFAYDPLNLVSGAPIIKGINAIRKGTKDASIVDKAIEGADDVAAQADASDLSEATVGAAQVQTSQPNQPTISLPEQLTQQSLPRVEGKFGSNRRPPQKSFDATSINSDTGLPQLNNPVKAMYGDEAKGFVNQLRSQEPRYANLTDVFNRDIRPQDYEKLQQSRVINETAQVADQAAKGNPAAVDLVTPKHAPLKPVARKSV